MLSRGWDGFAMLWERWPVGLTLGAPSEAGWPNHHSWLSSDVRVAPFRGATLWVPSHHGLR